MRAAICTSHDGPRAMEIQELPDPEVGEGQVLIDVAAAGLNFPDLLMTRGLYQLKPPPPFSPGGEVAGVVSQVGEDVTANIRTIAEGNLPGDERFAANAARVRRMSPPATGQPQGDDHGFRRALRRTRETAAGKEAGVLIAAIEVLPEALETVSRWTVGIAFAIPSETVERIVAQLRDTGEVERGFLGVQIQPVTEDLAAGLGLDEAQGAIVGRVTADSPAAEAGFAVGDVVLSVEGEAIEDARDLSRTIAFMDPGETIAVEILREGDRETIEVTIAMPALGPSLGVAPSGTWTWMSVRSKRGGSTPMAGAIERTKDEAASIDSFMTSPSVPVVFILPLPGRRSASIDRRSPPTCVQARPVATPTASSSSARP